VLEWRKQRGGGEFGVLILGVFFELVGSEQVNNLIENYLVNWFDV
jgi:hypothetical protein